MNNCYGFDKQFNNMYSNVFYENRWWRLYDEVATDSFDSLYSETQIKLIELIELYNFKIFYFNCKPNTNYKLIITDTESMDKSNVIDYQNEDVKQIKRNQRDDFYYIYINELCEVFYSFPKLNENDNYYYDFMIVVNNNFKIDNIFKHNFKTVSIISVKEITLNDLTFDFIKSVFNPKIWTYDVSSQPDDEDYYNFSEDIYNSEDYEKYQKNGLDYDHDEYLNYSSFILEKNIFKSLCTHIWSFERKYFIEQNKFGLRLIYKEIYNINSPFLTNFGELVNCKTVDFKNKKVEKVYYTYCCLSDNLHDQNIFFMGFRKEILNGKKIDFSSLKIVEADWD